jgi:hypothetical protein
MKVKNTEGRSDGVLKPVFAAYLVLLLHLLMIVGMGLVVIFFSGIVAYLSWIFLGGILAIGASGYFFFRRMRAEGRNLREMMNASPFAGQNLEIEFLGGLASVKIGQAKDAGRVHPLAAPTVYQLEDPTVVRVRELGELARLLEDGFISREEFARLKTQIIGPSNPIVPGADGPGEGGGGTP